jgi:serine/threonine protein kinase
LPQEDPRRLPEVGDLIAGRFRISGLLGQGGFSTVYRAHQESIGRDVAIKFLAPEAAGQSNHIERFRREALHISQLRHPNMIRLYDYGQTPEGLFFIVMEFAQGRSLGELLSREGGLGSVRGLRLLSQICQGLAEAHGLGIVHRDLKPENIFVCDLYGERDVVKVLDFGLARSEALWEGGEGRLTGKGRAFGTPMYMAPEQIRGEVVTPRADVYALALLSFELLTGRRPVEGKTRKEVLRAHLSEAIPVLTPELAQHPLGEVLTRAASKDAARRYEDAGALWEALRAASGRGGELAPAPLQATLRPRGEAAEVTRPQIPSSPGSQEILTLEQAREALSVEEAAQAGIQWGAEARRGELSALQVWSRSLLRGGKMRLTVVLGEAGSGKSRLLRAWRRWVQQEQVKPPLTLGVGYCRSAASHPLEPAREALLGAVRAAGVSLGELLEGALAGGHADAGELARAAAALQGDGEAWGHSPPLQLVAGFGELALALARRGALVLLIEDIDQASEVLCALLRDLLVRADAESAPLAVLLAGRRDRAARNAALQGALERLRTGRPAVLDLSLGPLTRAECDAFIGEMLAADEGLKGLLYARSQGNPLFVVHLLRYLEARSLLSPQRGGWGLSVAATRDGALPMSLAELLQRRLDQAVYRHPQSPGLRLLMQWLALLGQRAPLRLVAQAMRVAPQSDAEAKLRRDLEVLAEEGFVRWEAEEEVVIFDHLLVREALLEEIAGLRAAGRLHRAAAEVKRQGFPAEQAPLLEIAQHYQAAGDLRRAREFLLRAAEQARQREELRRARDLYRVVARELPEADEARAPTWLALAEVEEALGESGPAEDHFRAAAEGQGAEEVTQEASLGLARVLALQGHLEQAEEVSARALQRARAGRSQEGLLRALMLDGELARRRGERGRAVERQREIRGLLGAVSSPRLVARARLHIGEAAQEEGQHEAAALHLSAALERFEEAGDLVGVSDVRVSQAALALRLGQLEEAEEDLQRALARKRALADRQGVAQICALLSEVAYKRGEFATAERHLLRAEELLRALGARHALGRALSLLGELRERLGDPAAAAQALVEAQGLLEAAGDQRALSACLLRQSTLSLNATDRAAARARARQALLCVQSDPRGAEYAAAQLQLALVATWDGELETAARMLRALLEAPPHPQRATARGALGVVLLLRGHEDEAAALLGEEIPLEQLSWPDAADRFLHGCMTFYAVMTRQGRLLARLTPHCYRLSALGPMPATIWLAWLHGAIQSLPEDTPEALRQDALDGVDALRTLLKVN